MLGGTPRETEEEQGVRLNLNLENTVSVDYELSRR